MQFSYDLYEKWYQFTVRDGVGEIRRGYADELKLKMLEKREETNVDDLVTNIMIDYAYIVFNVTREECHSSDYVLQAKEQDFRDMISEYTTSSAVLYAKGSIKMLKGTVLDMNTYKSMLEMQ